jgi:hypothetical protein
MDSFFNTTLKTNKETNNLIYNVINSQDPKQIFLYAFIIVIITFISTKIIYNINILIGLIFCSLIIYYLYTFRKQNILTDEQKFEEKFNSICTNDNILNKYPKIVDFLFYMENFKYKSIENYNEIINSFQNFCKIYEYCLIDYNLIFKNYKKLLDLKDQILSQINNFIFIYENVEYEIILIKQQNSAEKIINELLNNLVILFKKKIYYDGYTNNTKIIDYSNIMPYNIFYQDNNNRDKNYEYNVSNLILI